MILESLTSFIIALLIVVVAAALFKCNLKGFFGILVNALFGGIVLVALNLFNIAYFPVNPLNAAIVGALGVFGLALIYVIIIVKI